MCVVEIFPSQPCINRTGFEEAVTCVCGGGGLAALKTGVIMQWPNDITHALLRKTTSLMSLSSTVSLGII